MTQRLSSQDETKLLGLFERISAIPRPSGKEREIAAFLLRFAAEHGLEAFGDEANNVLIRVCASPDQAEEAPLILQGHTDMVFITDDAHRDHTEDEPIRLQYDGAWIGAEGTSLGADDGVALAVMLALADDPPPSHPPLELLFTAGEEIGLVGAKAFNCSQLQGRRLINLDGDEEATAVIGCAGGRRLDLKKEITYCPTDATDGLCIHLNGLQGGHSGVQIHQPLGNALKRMGELLNQFPRTLGFHICECNGGTVDNAIPSSCRLILIPSCPTELMALRSAIEALAQRLLPQWRKTDPDATLELSLCPVERIPQGYALDLLPALMQKAPHGVQAYSKTAPDTVADSVNFASIRITDQALELAFSVRSFSQANKDALSQRIAALAEEHGFSVSLRGDYPGWEPRSDSPLLRAYETIARETFQREPRVYPIHAGLECGVFHQAIPNLDAISIGCEISDIHSPDERLNRESLLRLYRLVRTLISKSKQFF